MKKTSRKTQYRSILSAIAMLLVAVVASVSALYAWFAERDRVAVGNVSLSVVGANVTLGDITFVRMASLSNGAYVRMEETYCNENDGYYRYENGEAVFVEGEKQPLAVGSLLGGETVILLIKFKVDNGYDGYEICFNGVGGDTYRQNDADHALACVFQYTNDMAVIFGDGSGAAWNNFAEYRENGGETVAGRIVADSGAVQAVEDGYMTMMVAFRMNFDLLPTGTRPSVLAGKALKIGSIGVYGVHLKTENGS